MENKYLTKIASDLSIAEKSHGEEEKAISDYGHRLKEANNPGLKDAIHHAREEERDHSKRFKDVIQKLTK